MTHENTTTPKIKKYFDNVFDNEWDIKDSRIGDIKHSKANVVKLNNIGWYSKIDLKTGLRRCLKNI